MRVVDERVRSECPRHAVDHRVLPGHLQVSESLAEIAVARDALQIEGAREPGLDDRGGGVARRRDQVDRLRTTSPQLGDEVIARPHVGCVDLDAARLLERLREQRVGVALPDHEVELAPDRFGAQLGQVCLGVGSRVARGRDADLGSGGCGSGGGLLASTARDGGRQEAKREDSL